MISALLPRAEGKGPSGKCYSSVKRVDIPRGASGERRGGVLSVLVARSCRRRRPNLMQINTGVHSGVERSAGNKMVKTDWTA